MAATNKSRSKSKFQNFNWNDTLIVAIQKRAVDNPKAAALLSRIVMRSSDRKIALVFLFHLSNLGFYGEDIWYGFTEFCKSDEEVFQILVEIEDKSFYDFILDWKAREAVKQLKGKD